MVMAAVILSGCPAGARRDSPLRPPIPIAPSSGAGPTVPTPGLPSPRPPPAVRENRLSPATRALATQAKSLLARGDFDAASSTMDRALRVEPNNPLLWIELGRVRLAENDARQAESCGRKALALASGDRIAQRQAGRLLADALRLQKRNQEAHDAESQPYMK